MSEGLHVTLGDGVRERERRAARVSRSDEGLVRVPVDAVHGVAVALARAIH